MRIVVIPRFALLAAVALAILVGVCALTLPAITAMTRSGRAIVIDPGHGGVDGGAYIAGEVVEKELTLDISLALRSALAASGLKLALTRDRDVDLSPRGRHMGGSRYRQDLAGRVRAAQDAGAALFVSIHANYSRDSRVRGPIVFYKPDSTASRRLAQCIHDALAEFGPQQRGPVPGAFYVLRHSRAPAVLVEVGFISNPKERALLKTAAYRARIAASIAHGIRAYLGGVATSDEGSSAHASTVATPAVAAPAVARGAVPVYFPRRGTFALTPSLGDEAAMPALAPSGRPEATELVARSVLARLLTGPADPALLAPAVPAGTVLRGVVYRGGTLTVDFSTDLAALCGACDEYLTVYSIVDSLCGVPGVERVQLLVEGKRLETLAGHIDIEHPLTPLYAPLLNSADSDGGQ